jgi:hypothetical protein
MEIEKIRDEQDMRGSLNIQFRNTIRMMRFHGFTPMGIFFELQSTLGHAALEETGTWKLGDIADIRHENGEYWGKVVIFGIPPLPEAETDKYYGVVVIRDDRYARKEGEKSRIGEKLNAHFKELAKPVSYDFSLPGPRDLEPFIKGVVHEEMSAQIKRIYGG